MDFAGRVAVITGGAQGIGRAVADRLAGGGAKVAIWDMDPDLARDAAAALGGFACACDVADWASVSEAYGKTEAALAVSDVNYSGALRVLGETVPAMVQAGRGDITLIGSLAGYHGLPAAIGYGSSKAALISLAETMRHDLAGTGVTVRIVNPGFIKTRLTDKNSFKMPMLMEPEDAAQRVLRAMARRRFRTDFPAPFSWVIRLIDYLPDLLVYRGK